MKKWICLLAVLCSIHSVIAQTGGMSAKEMERLSKMSPAELEKYQKDMVRKLEKQAQATAAAGNLRLDESLLQSSSLKLPELDSRRINLIATTPFSPETMHTQVNGLLQALKKVVPVTRLKSYDSLATIIPVAETEAAAIAHWYRQDPQGALYLALQAVVRKPADLLQVNNLAAILNMQAMPHRAIPLLEYCLQKAPTSSMVLNNLGQSWLNLGDIPQAEDLFARCLTIDSLNPEANRSMGMIHLAKQEPEAAAHCFAREEEVTYRRSSLAHLAKAENRHLLDLSALREKKMKREGTNNRDLFEEISLSKFYMPEFPSDSKFSDSLQRKNKWYARSVDEEIKFWSVAGIPDAAEKQREGNKLPGLYSELVTELMADLDNTYIPNLELFTEADHSQLLLFNAEFAQKLREVQCPPFPTGNNVTAEVIMAYERKCCDKKKPIIDQYLRQYNDVVRNSIGIVQPRWKTYLNAAINIVQLDPSPGNRHTVYSRVAQYFVFLQQAAVAGKFHLPPSECHVPMTRAQADSVLLQAKHELDFNCPEWLKLEVPVKAATLKLDCQSFSFEADMYGLLHAGIEKQFKSGTSTLWVSAGVDEKFRDFAKVEMTGKLYITWDQNNKFSDVGLKGTGSISVDQLGSAEFGYGFALNAGFNSQTELKNTFSENLDKAIKYIK
ncbi:MAG: tetratricopeptide repeat protein [Pseudobacter sp.]|uniref:tetratricopeptide repeat protein n=1 Tax=Pseudobacter sp. TaxID=2045420 RepID=UPI003F7D1149